MARKVRVLGPANDMIPEDELVLAKLVQNAAARGLRPTTGVAYRARNGKALDGFNIKGREDEIHSCCALGAAYLEPDTEGWVLPGVIEGNDGYAYSDGAYFDVGVAFQNVLR